MKWILIGIAAIIALALVAFLLGSLLPREHVATVRAKYAAKPDAVWTVIGDPIGSASWRKEVKSVERLPPVDGRLAWREEASFGKVNFVMAEWDPPRRMTVRITSDELPYGGQWDYSLTPVAGGTELSITERGFVKPALFRLLARLVFGYTSTMEGYLRGLGVKLGETVAPEVVASGR